MLTAALFHALAGFVFGVLGLKVPVLIVYGMGNIAVGFLAMATTDLTFLGLLGQLLLGITCASVGYVGGGWLLMVLEDKREESEQDDQPPRNKVSRIWISLR